MWYDGEEEVQRSVWHIVNKEMFEDGKASSYHFLLIALTFRSKEKREITDEAEKRKKMEKNFLTKTTLIYRRQVWHEWNEEK